jgi:glucosyl-3-phosphoglycerate synthase
VTREAWLLERTFTGARFDPDALAARRAASGTSVSVVVPALDVADTVGAIVAAIHDRWAGPGGLVDEVVVIDSASSDRTADVATSAGARVVQDAEVLPGLGTRRGKGEAMWKSLAATTGDVIAWIDGDIEDFDPAFVPGLLGPLLVDAEVGYVKAFYRRPLGVVADDGGRVTEICARPLINRFVPELAGFVQPLSGEAAGRRSLLEQVPFFCGYAVEIGLLIDILGTAGLEAMAQVDLGERRHRNQPTSALGPMAYEITNAVLARRGGGPAGDGYVRPVRSDAAGQFSLEHREVSLSERPPMVEVTRRVTTT